MSKQKVAVYGTLRYGNGNYMHYLKGRSRYLGEGTTKEKFLMAGAGIPFVSKRKEKTNIVIDLFEVTQSVIDNFLDPLENHPRWYNREKTTVIVDGVEHEAWLYFNDTVDYDRMISEGTEITNGDYNNSIYNDVVVKDETA